ncbi:MAG: C40 family peptidase [Gaiellaceae bacterium]
MSRRRISLACLLLAALTATAAAPGALAKQGSSSWAEPQIELVVEHGLMASDRASFDPSATLTRAELDELLPELAAWLPGSEGGGDGPAVPQAAGGGPPASTASPPPADGSASVSVSEFDRALVRELGLGDAATRFQRALRQAGLKPPARLGSETVARLLALRTNHPAKLDDLELSPSDPITHAEVAFSLAQVLSFDGSELAAVETAAQEFAPPALDPWQKRVLGVALGFVGYPYVWGGTSEQQQLLFGHQRPGGFDCSGFIWRVYRAQRYPGGAGLASVLRGRTAAAMAGEAPRSARIAVDATEPADVLFFGSKGPRSRAAQVDHAAISLGNGWLIQSSRYGVALVPLEGWYRDRLAWARRPLAEAGLEPSASDAASPGS